jgi:hypothetical protein
MKVVYIASPYTVGDPVLNVRQSLQIAEELYAEGFLPFAPLLCHLWHLAYPKPYEYWTGYSLEWVKRADYVLRMRGESRGADAEVALAAELHIPVFLSLSDLIAHHTRKHFDAN